MRNILSYLSCFWELHAVLVQYSLLIKPLLIQLFTHPF